MFRGIAPRAKTIIVDKSQKESSKENKHSSKITIFTSK